MWKVKLYPQVRAYLPKLYKQIDEPEDYVEWLLGTSGGKGQTAKAMTNPRI